MMPERLRQVWNTTVECDDDTILTFGLSRGGKVELVIYDCLAEKSMCRMCFALPFMKLG